MFAYDKSEYVYFRVVAMGQKKISLIVHLAIVCLFCCACVGALTLELKQASAAVGYMLVLLISRMSTVHV